MKKSPLLTSASLAVVLGASLLLAADKPAPASRVEPKALATLKQACDLLAASKSFTFEAYATSEHLLPSGQKSETARTSKIAIQRPNKISAAILGHTEIPHLFYDGKTVTFASEDLKNYAQIPAAATIDETLDLLSSKYKLAFPLADLVVADPYKAFTDTLRSGAYLGTSYVFDTKCHHLAFRQEFVDWQIWIDAGEKPLPVKLVITYKENPGHLSYTAFFTKWNLAAETPAATFTYTPPADAKKLELPNPATQPAQ